MKLKIYLTGTDKVADIQISETEAESFVADFRRYVSDEDKTVSGNLYACTSHGKTFNSVINFAHITRVEINKPEGEVSVKRPITTY